jgi:hypothetical protein
VECVERRLVGIALAEERFGDEQIDRVITRVQCLHQR